MEKYFQSQKLPKTVELNAATTINDVLTFIDNVIKLMRNESWWTWSPGYDGTIFSKAEQNPQFLWVYSLAFERASKRTSNKDHR